MAQSSGSGQLPEIDEKGKLVKVDHRALMDRFENDLAALKVQFEQFFMGLAPFPPDKEHKALQQLLRDLRRSPFKSSALQYRLRAIESRYNTYRTYWERVFRQREEGTYCKDVFRAEMRERHMLEDKMAQTEKGKAEKSFQAIFNAYKTALEKQVGQAQRLDYEAFKKNLLQRAKDFKVQTGCKKVGFAVVVKDGSVTVQAKAKG